MNIFDASNDIYFKIGHYFLLVFDVWLLSLKINLFCYLFQTLC